MRKSREIKNIREMNIEIEKNNLSGKKQYTYFWATFTILILNKKYNSKIAMTLEYNEINR